MFLPGTIVFPLLLAILVDRVGNRTAATLYRVVLLIPAVIPGTLVFVLWKWMYNYQIGPINHFLVEVAGLFTYHDAPQWLGGTSLTLPAIAVMEIWWGLGYHTVFFLAGYALVHLKFRGSPAIVTLLLASLYFPTRVVAIITIYEIQDWLELINSTSGLILPYVTLNLAVSVLIMRSVFQLVPAELMAAARIDGALAFAAAQRLLFRG